MDRETGPKSATDTPAKRATPLKILTVKGIDIRLHITFPLLLVFAAWPAISSPQIDFEEMAFSVVTILLLFVSVTLHELGHSLEALRLGIGVRGITLYPMGGIAWLERVPKNPWHELWITAAGPAVTFVLAGLLWLADQSLESRTLSREAPGLLDRFVLSGWGQIVGLLATMNLTLGLFNLIPAFPLDGGRIFRAVLAMRLEYVRATTIAARVGQGAAVLLAVSGLLDNSGVQYFGASIRIFIAFFIWTSAQAELNALKRRDGRAGQTAGDLMIRNVAVLGQHVSLASAQTFMAGSQQNIYPVLDSVGRPVGWVTRTMVETALTRLIGGTAIREVMLAQVEYVGEDTPVQEAIKLMVEKRHPALAVVETDGRLRGILVINPAAAARPAGGSGLN